MADAMLPVAMICTTCGQRSEKFTLLVRDFAIADVVELNLMSD